LDDLGGLGAKDSGAGEFDWKRVNPLPKVLPWALLLALFGLKFNRPSKARLIVIPLALVLFAVLVFQKVTTTFSSRFEMLGLLAGAMAMGMAMLWLVTPLLHGRSRTLTFLKISIILAGGACLTYWADASFQIVKFETVGILIGLVVGAVMASLSLSLAGFCCRKPHGPWRYPLCLIGFLLLASVLAFVIIAFASGSFPPLLVMFPIIGVFALLNMAYLLPFLILSASSAFYRERFRALVGMPAKDQS
jgi:hypothetical protein